MPGPPRLERGLVMLLTPGCWSGMLAEGCAGGAMSVSGASKSIFSSSVKLRSSKSSACTVFIQVLQCMVKWMPVHICAVDLHASHVSCIHHSRNARLC